MLGIAKTVVGLALLTAGVAWAGFLFGGAYAFSVFAPHQGWVFDYDLFVLYVSGGIISAVVGIILVILGNGRN